MENEIPEVQQLIALANSVKAGESKSKSPKGVVVDKAASNKQGQVNPTLSQAEKTRLKNIFGILKDILAPEPEAERLKSTATGKVAAPAISTATQEVGDTGGMNFGKLGALLGAGIAALAFWLRENVLDPMGEWLLKTGLKIKGIIKTFGGVFNSIVKSIGGVFDAIKGSKLVKAMLGGLEAGGLGAKIIKTVTKAGGGLLKVLKGTVKMIGAPLLKTLKFLPFIGSLVSFGFAISRFKEGDWFKGTFELISGIANLLPGAGWIVSALIDGGLAISDMMETPEQKEERIKEQSGKGFFEIIGDSIMNTILPKLEYLPVFGGIIGFGKAIAAFTNGDTVDGIRELYSASYAMMGGKGMGDVALKGFDFLYGLVVGDGEVDTPAALSGSSFGDMVSDLWDSAGNAVSNVVNKAKDWVTDSLFGWLDSDGGSTTSAAMRQNYGYSRMNYKPSAQDAYIDGKGNVTRLNSGDDFIALKKDGAIDRVLNKDDGKLAMKNSAMFDDMRKLSKVQVDILASIREELIGMRQAMAVSSTATASSPISLNNTITTSNSLI